MTNEPSCNHEDQIKLASKRLPDAAEPPIPTRAPAGASSTAPKCDPATTSTDPFDPASLRLGQDFSNSVGVQKVITNVPVRKPNNQEFIRVRSGEEWRVETAAFEVKAKRETYLVAPSLWPDLGSDIHPLVLLPTITRAGDVFIWPCKLPGPDGRTNSWNESALAAALIAERKWIRVKANMEASAYDTYAAGADFPEPEWPDLELKDLLRLAFQDRYIKSSEHPVLKALRGEQ